jgi:hypothetical protein
MLTKLSSYIEAYSKFIEWFKDQDYYFNNSYGFKFDDFKNRFPFEFQLGIFLKFIEKNKLTIKIVPEYYLDGINWNFQIFWYLDNINKEELLSSDDNYSFYEGTMMYGDNNEYPTQDSCYKEAIIFCFNLIDNKIKSGKFELKE